MALLVWASFDFRFYCLADSQQNNEIDWKIPRTSMGL